MTDSANRRAVVTRVTGETDITAELDLDGTGTCLIDTGVPFFDHMLNAFGRHGLFDLTVRATGDIEVDAHHTVEDTGIVLGQAFTQALGEDVYKRQYRRCRRSAAASPSTRTRTRSLPSRSPRLMARIRWLGMDRAASENS